MVKIISFANQKGGVGKTTTAINIAASLAAIKKRVLLIDMDSQGNAGTGLGFVRAAHKQSVYGVLMGTAGIAENILTTAIPNMHLLPASAKLAGAELDMLDLDNREYRLRDALKTIQNNYDYILIDCPPNLGMLTINALSASDYVVIPLQCEFFALEGVQQLLSTIKAIQEKWNPGLDVLGMVLTMYDKKLGLHAQLKKMFAILLVTKFSKLLSRVMFVFQKPPATENRHYFMILNRQAPRLICVLQLKSLMH